MKIRGNNDPKPKLKPSARVKTDPTFDTDISASMDIPHRQRLADSKTSSELQKDMDAYSSSSHYHAARGNTKAVKIASREYRNRESALEARKETNKQDKQYVADTIAPKYRKKRGS